MGLRFPGYPGWTFDVEERSGGRFEARGVHDPTGLSVAADGTDPDDLIDLCKTTATRTLARLLEPIDLVDDHLNFAGESLLADDALARQAELADAGKRVMLVPAKYAHPSISPQRAVDLAVAVYASRVERYDTAFAAPRVLAESPMFITVLFPSPVWQAEGRVPGGVVISIDKLDGHVWEQDEVEMWLTASGHSF